MVIYILDLYLVWGIHTPTNSKGDFVVKTLVLLDASILKNKLF